MKTLGRLLAFSLVLNLMAASVFAQTYELRGTVTDQNGKPLAGVNIVVKGTLRGTTTDAEGKYSISLGAQDVLLVFSYVGYRKQEVRASGRMVIDVTLQEGVEYSEVLVVGTRSANRSVTETPVAIDVLDLSDMSARQGQLDIHQILQYAAPSFNANRQSGADGADHIDPATLRGLGPDQTLVLVNGKRRHQSSNINIFGSRGRGNTGTDLNAIPVSAIERVEILRDGASAQYGSD
ncbi:MAG: carboxypeptidase-like regulatory domain-containing protein, partial [Bacteroidota bacterium]